MFFIVAYIILTAILAFAAWQDVKSRTVGNVYPLLILLLSAAVVTYKCLSDRDAALNCLSWAIAGAGAGFVLTAIPAVKGEMGGADVKVLTAAGLGLGFLDICFLMLISFIIALIAAAALLIRKKLFRKEKADMKLRIPLLPSICAGTAFFAIFKLMEFIKFPGY